ncbi:MAG: hypothetical protein A4E64_01757 [Syntrophorhabdus sp. PtaU1.Bin058]|nr:MAG: hypothetical protein A4E64_01757 [Syntrophorhabdus sp. PtaU1.Bin058]
MNITDFAIVIIRFFGLWLLFHSVLMIEQTISVALYDIFKQNPDYQHFAVFLNLLNMILYIAMGMILVWKPRLIADRVVPRKAREINVRITTTGLMFLCFSTAGLVFLVDGISDLIYFFSRLKYSREDPGYIIGRNGQPGFLAAAFRTMMGLWLLFGFKRITKGLRYVWSRGRTIGIREPDKGTNENEQQH